MLKSFSPFCLQCQSILCYWFSVQAVTLVRKLRNFSLPENKLKKLEFFLPKFPLCLSNQPNKILSIPIQY